MEFIKASHVIVVILLGCYGLLGLNNPNIGFFIYWALLVLYVGLVVGVFKNVLWCIRLSLLPPLLAFLVSAPMVLFNAYAFLVGHSLYQDSPATILVVAIIAVFVTIPAFFVVVAYWKNRGLWLNVNT